MAFCDMLAQLAHCANETLLQVGVSRKGKVSCTHVVSVPKFGTQPPGLDLDCLAATELER